MLETEYKVEHEGLKADQLWKSGIARRFTDDQKKDLVVQALSANFMEHSAAHAVGWSRDELRKHRHQDPEFDSRCRLGETHGTSLLHVAIMRQIMPDPESKHEGDGRLALAYLELQEKMRREHLSADLREQDIEVRKEDRRKRKAEADIAEHVAELVSENQDDDKLKRLEAVTKGLASVQGTGK